MGSRSPLRNEHFTPVVQRKTGGTAARFKPAKTVLGQHALPFYRVISLSIGSR
jgi:hypothetical protein